MPSPDANLERFSARASDGLAGCSKGCVKLCDDCLDLELTEGWDADTIEALTGVGETPEARMVPVETVAAAAPEPVDRSWLDNRLAEIASKLEHTLQSQNPAPALGAFSERLDNFEARLETALARADAREDRDSLRFIEAHIREIDDQFDKMRGQIARIDGMDARLSDLIARLQLLPDRSEGLEGLVEGAVSRALAAANVLSSGTQSGGGAEAVVLGRIEEALGRLLERVEDLEHAALKAERDDLAKDDIRLSKAYAEGARALGRTATSEADLQSARNLHASDYVTAPRDTGEEPAPRMGARALLGEFGFKTALSSTPARVATESSADVELSELKASAVRARQRAQAAAEASADEDADDLPSIVLRKEPAQPRTIDLASMDMNSASSGMAMGQSRLSPDSAAGVQRSLAKGRWNRGFFLFLAAGMLGLGSASFVAVDRMMGSSLQVAAQAPLGGVEKPTEEPTRIAQSVNPGQDIPAAPAAPVALPPADQQPDNVGAAARAAALPATIASAALRHAAANGDPAAEFEIAARYAEGRGVAADQVQAFVWYQRAAMHGYMPAQFRLGSHYEHGVGTEKDLERARIWYGRAAAQGHAKAMHNLGALTASGGTKADLERAAQWFREAAERNLADSQYNLAVMYESGQGVDVNLAEACKWFALAARSGDLEAGKRLQAVKGQLSKGEIAAVEKAVATWMPLPAQAMPETAKADRAAP